MRQNIPILSLFFVDVILFSRLGRNAKHAGAFLSKKIEENAKITGKKARCRPAYHHHHGIFHGAFRAVLTPFPLRKSKTSDFFDTNLGTLWAKVRHFVLKKADVSGLPSRHFYVSLPIFRPFFRSKRHRIRPIFHPNLPSWGQNPPEKAEKKVLPTSGRTSLPCQQNLRICNPGNQSPRALSSSCFMFSRLLHPVICLTSFPSRP